MRQRHQAAQVHLHEALALEHHVVEVLRNVLVRGDVHAQARQDLLLGAAEDAVGPQLDEALGTHVAFEDARRVLVVEHLGDARDIVLSQKRPDLEHGLGQRIGNLDGGDHVVDVRKVERRELEVVAGVDMLDLSAELALELVLEQLRRALARAADDEDAPAVHLPHLLDGELQDERDEAGLRLGHRLAVVALEHAERRDRHLVGQRVVLLDLAEQGVSHRHGEAHADVHGREMLVERHAQVEVVVQVDAVIAREHVEDLVGQAVTLLMHDDALGAAVLDDDPLARKQDLEVELLDRHVLHVVAEAHGVHELDHQVVLGRFDLGQTFEVEALGIHAEAHRHARERHERHLDEVLERELRERDVVFGEQPFDDAAVMADLELGVLTELGGIEPLVEEPADEKATDVVLVAHDLYAVTGPTVDGKVVFGEDLLDGFEAGRVGGR